MADEKKVDSAMVLRNTVRAGDLIKTKALLKDGADFAQAGNTTRKWTPLHIACWGTSRPANDREIVEAILIAAQKAGKTCLLYTSPSPRDS